MFWQRETPVLCNHRAARKARSSQSLCTGMLPFPKAYFEAVAPAVPPETPIRINHSLFCAPVEH